jgi:hypothetical protein
MPILNLPRPGEDCQNEGDNQGSRLGKNEELLFGQPVDYHARKQGEEQHRRKLESAYQAQKERRIGQPVSKPRLSGVLHPGARGGNAHPEPVIKKVFMLQGGKWIADTYGFHKIFPNKLYFLDYKSKWKVFQ